MNTRVYSVRSVFTVTFVFLSITFIAAAQGALQLRPSSDADKIADATSGTVLYHKRCDASGLAGQSWRRVPRFT